MIARLFSCALLIAAIPPALADQVCSGLSALSLPRTTIVSAVVVPAGTMAPPAGAPDAPAIAVRARCEVRAITRPTSDSEIHFLVWLPVSGWNGKYLQVGNGGWAGSINPTAMINPFFRGYAVGATDDGHGSAGSVPSAAWAIGHPEKLIDFGYRAVHETSVQARLIVHAFFGHNPIRSYFTGCSDGGREALMEAQRYPEEFDGIIAGAPANEWSHLFTGFVWNEQALADAPIPSVKLPAIQKAVLALCDAQDGVKDGLIEDPRTCHFDPGSMLCKNADAPDCLTPGQVIALRRIYGGPTNPRTGKQIFPGYPMGAEAIPGGWLPWIVPPPAVPASLQASFGNSYYGHAVFERLDWNFRTLNFDSDVELGDAKAAPVLNSTNPDLRSFRDHGGKLIQYHGWGDAAISPLNSINYFESVRDFLSRFPDPRHTSTDPMDFYRLFMVPGMAHCAGGMGPNDFGNAGRPTHPDAQHDVLSALEAWVEHGAAPAKLIGSGKDTADPAKLLTRPLCPYPQTAHYVGNGDPDDATNFTCQPPPS
jgi:feruloyl esterase